MAKTVLISINASWNIINFRKGLIRGLQDAGYRVVVAAPEDAYSRQISELGAEYIPLDMDKQGLSPPRDLLLLARYFILLRRVRPDIFLGYTAKPNVYGSLACRALAIPVINNVAGLGTAFIAEGWLTRLVTRMYRLAFGSSKTVFFQNPEDMRLFLDKGIVREHQARLLPGSGIDLELFKPASASGMDGKFRFLLVARLLWDKGVREYVEAARTLRASHPDARFQILGFTDVENRTAVSRATVDEWGAEGVIEYLGPADDVRPFIAAADCVVLPSYREGLPRVLLEAAAMGKPLIATDVPGCRDVVEHGKNGFLCAVRDGASLGAAMTKMIDLLPFERQQLGAFGRRKVEAGFDEKIVVDRYLSAIAEAIGQ